MCGRLPDSGEPALPAASAAPASSSAASDRLPGRNDGSSGFNLPGSAAASAVTPAIRRTRLSGKEGLLAEPLNASVR